MGGSGAKGGRWGPRPGDPNHYKLQPGTIGTHIIACNLSKQPDPVSFTAVDAFVLRTHFILAAWSAVEANACIYL